MIKDSTTLAKSEDDSSDYSDKDGVDSIVGVKAIHNQALW